MVNTSPAATHPRRNLRAGNARDRRRHRLATYSSKIGPDLRQIKPIPRRCGLARAIWTARSPCAVPTSANVLYSPTEISGDRQVRSVADAGHRRQEILQARRVGIQRVERSGAAVAGLVLRLARAKRLSQMAPEAIEAVIRHLEHAADIAGLLRSRKSSVSGALQ